jgi:hypothetical protein
LPLFLAIALIKYKNLKEALRYVSRKTAAISGISYSKREWKTNYFNYCYEKYKNAHVISNRVVFLSERKHDNRGNYSY